MLLGAASQVHHHLYWRDCLTRWFTLAKLYCIWTRSSTWFWSEMPSAEAPRPGPAAGWLESTALRRFSRSSRKRFSSTYDFSWIISLLERVLFTVNCYWYWLLSFLICLVSSRSFTVDFMPDSCSISRSYSYSVLYLLFTSCSYERSYWDSISASC